MQRSEIPLVSVVIPAYNHRDFVAEAIGSALGQDYPRTELIVIDDGSTDGTTEEIDRVWRESRQGFRFVRKRNEGLVPTLNLGLSMARGKYFTQFGSDDVLLPDSVTRRVEVLEASPAMGLVCGDAYLLEGRRRTDRRILGRRARKYFPRKDMYRELLLHNFIINLTVMYPRKLFAGMGGFDEAIPFFEDWDAVLRLAEHHPVGYVDEPLGYWRSHHSNTSKRLDWMFTGILATLEKHFREGRLAHRGWFRRHVFSRIFYKHGKQKFLLGNDGGALESFTTSLQYNPFYVRAYPYLFRTLRNHWWPRKRGGSGRLPGRDPSLRM